MSDVEVGEKSKGTLCDAYGNPRVSRWGNTFTAGLKNRTYNGTFNKSEANYETHDCVRLRAWLHIWGGPGERN